jgi:hypothetical protein
VIDIEWPVVESFSSGDRPAPSKGSGKAASGKKPPAKNGNKLSADDKKFIKQNTSGDFNSKHPRAAAGSASGGQFAKGSGSSSGGKGSGGKGSAKSSGGGKATLAGASGSKTPAGGGGLAYKAGYDKKGGSPQVKGLQSKLNKLGLTDAAGKPLAVDGKLGPKTTAAIKKAQKRLGMKPTGKADGAFLSKLKAGNTGKAKLAHGTKTAHDKKAQTKKGPVGKLVQGRFGKLSGNKRTPAKSDKRPLAGSAGQGMRKGVKGV